MGVARGGGDGRGKQIGLQPTNKNQPTEQTTNLCLQSLSTPPITNPRRVFRHARRWRRTGVARSGSDGGKAKSVSNQQMRQITNQPTNQANYQSTNPTEQPIHLSTIQPTNKPTDQPTNQSANQTAQKTTNQENQLASQPTNNQPTDQSINQPGHLNPINQLIIQLTNQPTYKPIRPLPPNHSPHPQSPTSNVFCVKLIMWYGACVLLSRQFFSQPVL